MAAGRQNFSRRRQKTHSYRFRYDQRYDASDIDRPSTLVTKLSGGRTGDYGRNCFIDDGGSRFVYQFDHISKERKREVNVSKDASFSGSTKKRKLSRNVCDRVEKQVKIFSKNRILSNSEVITRFSSPDSFEDFGRIERCPVPAESEHQSSSVDSFVSNVSYDVEIRSSMAARTPEEHGQVIEDEEEECVGVRNLSKSKWAFDDSPGVESDVNNSSPESGEFKREETNSEVSSLAGEDDHFLALSSEDLENADDKVASGESDNDRDAPLCTGLDLWPSCRNVFEFERLGKISEGTYGVVHKARDKKTGDIVALKKVKVKSDREGFPVTALREISILGTLQHPSLVKMREVVTDDFDGIYMVMEYIDYELKGYMERMRQPFNQSEVKRLMIQLLEGVSYLHDNYVMHRDLKTSNLLLDNKGELRICDFGMSRQYASPLKPYTPLVVTLWYRAPELLLGMKNYSTAVDMWSVGCVMAEMLSKKPLFDGNTELEQINKIFRTLGTPNELIWPGYSKLPGVKPNFVKQPCNTLRKKFPAAVFTGSPTLTELGFDLLNRFLTYDPEKRITAEEALDHGWFREAPLPAEHIRICK